LKKRISIFCNVGHHIELFEIQLEIAQQHLDRGDHVEFLFCDGLIPICEINIEKKLNTCIYCIGRRNSGFKMLKGKALKKNLYQFFDISDYRKIKYLKSSFNNLEELKNYQIDDFVIGQAVYSSIADIKRDCFPNLVDYKVEINKFIKAAGRIYFCMLNYIKKRNPDLVYIFNGRHALERPVIEACRKSRVNFKTYEFAYNGGYVIQENTLIQDIKAHIKTFHKITKGVDQKLIEKAGRFFYENNIGLRQGSISFDKKSFKFVNNKYDALDRYKKEKVLPRNWDKKKYNIVIFQSSEYEDHTAEEFFSHRKVYPNQEIGLKKIATECFKRDKSIHLYIKLHPSYMFWNVRPKELDNVLGFELPNNVSLILPDSKFDSYHLMDKANKVVAFRSTAAIESAYRKKPVIILEDHIIAKLNSVYLAKNHEDAISLICDKKLPHRKIDDALKFGFYHLFQGITPKYYTRDPSKSYEENWGLFKGRKVIPSKIVLSIIKFNHIVSNKYNKAKLLMKKLKCISFD
jgi:hypothetical protein